jgi:hypothetical protein
MYQEVTLSHKFSLMAPSVLHDAMKHSVMHAAGFFFFFVGLDIYVLINTVLSAAPFHCVGGCWDSTQD